MSDTENPVQLHLPSDPLPWEPFNLTAEEESKLARDIRRAWHVMLAENCAERAWRAAQAAADAESMADAEYMRAIAQTAQEPDPHDSLLSDAAIAWMLGEAENAPHVAADVAADEAASEAVVAALMVADAAEAAEAAAVAAAADCEARKWWGGAEYRAERAEIITVGDAVTVAPFSAGVRRYTLVATGGSHGTHTNLCGYLALTNNDGPAAVALKTALAPAANQIARTLGAASDFGAPSAQAGSEVFAAYAAAYGATVRVHAARVGRVESFVGGAAATVDIYSDGAHYSRLTPAP